MAEKITLTTPIAKPSQTTIQLRSLRIDVGAKLVEITWEGNNGEPGAARYLTPAPAGSGLPSGADLISALNTANLTSNSLVRRVLARLQTDGHVPAGTIGGTPE